MDNPTIVTVLGSVFAAIVLAGFSLWSGKIQKKESETVNQSLRNLVEQKNEELAKKSDDQARNLEVYTQKLEKYATEQKAKDKEIIDIQKQLTADAIAQKEKTEAIANLSLKLNQAQEKLNEAQEKTIAFSSESLNYLTGGDSYCFISLSKFEIEKAQHNLKVLLFHVGKYPLSALRVSITRTSAVWREAGNNGARYKHLLASGVHRIIFPVGPLPSSPEPYELGIVPFEPKVDESFHIQFFAQNGTWSQSYNITYSNNGQSVIESKGFKDGKEIKMGYSSPKF